MCQWRVGYDKCWDSSMEWEQRSGGLHWAGIQWSPQYDHPKNVMKMTLPTRAYYTVDWEILAVKTFRIDDPYWRKLNEQNISYGEYCKAFSFDENYGRRKFYEQNILLPKISWWSTVLPNGDEASILYTVHSYLAKSIPFDRYLYIDSALFWSHPRAKSQLLIVVYW